MKIPIKAFKDDPTLSWEVRFNRLKAHHEEETTWLIARIQELEDAAPVQLPLRFPAFEIVEAPGDLCGNSKRLASGERCPGCRACC